MRQSGSARLLRIARQCKQWEQFETHCPAIAHGYRVAHRLIIDIAFYGDAGSYPRARRAVDNSGWARDLRQWDRERQRQFIDAGHPEQIGLTLATLEPAERLPRASSPILPPKKPPQRDNIVTLALGHMCAYCKAPLEFNAVHGHLFETEIGGSRAVGVLWDRQWHDGDSHVCSLECAGAAVIRNSKMVVAAMAVVEMRKRG